MKVEEIVNEMRGAIDERGGVWAVGGQTFSTP